MSGIAKIKARQIIDSRGNPTLETTVLLDNGQSAKAAVPSGASTGSHEAVELRDGNPLLFNGNSVLKAIENVNIKINGFLKGMKITDQELIDRKMLQEDGSLNKSNLGANSILSVSLACARLAALYQKKQLFEYLNELSGTAIAKNAVIPLFNVINGGMHAGGSVKFQEFFIIPHRNSFSESLQAGCELYRNLKNKLKSLDKNTNVGDEGGFAPHFDSNGEVLSLLAGETADKNFSLGLDIASSTFYSNGYYTPEDRPLNSPQYIEYLEELATKYELKIIEDPLFEDDWSNWKTLTAKTGKNIRLIGDDLLVTNKTRLLKAINEKSCNGILIKVNQIGTLTETLNVVKEAKKANFTVIVSHRSGETNDDFISDLAVAVSADYVKFGAPARGERVAKYNRLLEIYEQIQGTAPEPGVSPGK